MTTSIPAWVNGELTPVDKLEAHLNGLKHKAVSVFAVKGTEILMQRRALSKYHTPGLWANTCCTHPLWGEESADCAVRRLEDELGITGLFPEFRHHLEYRADVGGGMIEHEAVDVFLAHVHRPLKMVANPEEVMEPVGLIITICWLRFAAIRNGSPHGSRSILRNTPTLFLAPI